MASNGFNKMGVPVFKARKIKALNRPTKSWYWAAGFSFSHGSLVKECPYDLTVGDVFFGEEIY